MRSIKYLIINIFLFVSVVSLVAQETQLSDFTWKEGIKTVQLYKEGWRLSYPVIQLMSGEKLVLGFDEISDDAKNYTYKIIHCTKDWEPSDLLYAEYAGGFEENEIEDYFSSFNTTVKYTHYEVQIPNDKVKLKISGNYVVQVFDDFNHDELILSKRFFVYEAQASIAAEVQRATLPSYTMKKQEVDLVISHNSRQISDPFKELFLVISQNYRFDNAVFNLKPKYIESNKLIYNYEEGNLFDGLSEFRYFNCKNIRLLMDRIRNITYVSPFYHFELDYDEDRAFHAYSYEQDINGNYFIEGWTKDDVDRTADYVFVYFTLKQEAPYPGGDVYVFGALSDWQLKKEFQLNYSFERKQYEATIMLKQGYYNYFYALKEHGKNQIDVEHFEGSHYQTENNYLILLYESTFGARYDKLIGAEVINTLKVIE